MMYDYVAENCQLEEIVPSRPDQPMLFDFMEPDPGPEAEHDYLGRSCKRCGTCASMDTTLPGCVPGQIGRCIDPTARSYYLKPENARANDWLPEGDPAKYKQGELFTPELPPEFFWKACWNWDGPEVGGYCEVGVCIADRADGAGSIYCYMEQCLVLEVLPDGRYLVEIAMGATHGKPWAKDGTRLVLAKDEIWAPTRQLRGES